MIEEKENKKQNDQATEETENAKEGEDIEEKEEKRSDDEDRDKKEKVEEEEDELEKCRAELSECQDRYLRAHAEFDNMKKRLEKDKATAVAFANEGFAEDLLSVIDSFESALLSMDQIESDTSEEAIEKIKEGMLLTYEQLIKVLQKHGVEEIVNEGVFDPYVHQVVQQMESEEHESGEIIKVLQKGYKMKERVLRPSVVCTKK